MHLGEAQLAPLGFRPRLQDVLSGLTCFQIPYNADALFAALALLPVFVPVAAVDDLAVVAGAAAVFAAAGVRCCHQDHLSGKRLDRLHRTTSPGRF